MVEYDPTFPYNQNPPHHPFPAQGHTHAQTQQPSSQSQFGNSQTMMMSSYPQQGSQQEPRVPNHQPNTSINSIHSVQSTATTAEPLTPPDMTNYSLKFSPWTANSSATGVNGISGANGSNSLFTTGGDLSSKVSNNSATPFQSGNSNNMYFNNNRYTYQPNLNLLNEELPTLSSLKLDMALNNNSMNTEMQNGNQHQQQKRVMSMPHLAPAINFNNNVNTMSSVAEHKQSTPSLGITTGVNNENSNMSDRPPYSMRSSSVHTTESRKSSSMDRQSILKLNSVPIDTLSSDILALSKDQYGCRFLQKKIDENATTNFGPIFREVVSHSFELMIDPFGNYLMQKIMEFCSNNEKDLIIQNCLTNLYSIALNQHGTRALQKMIDCITTEFQVSMIRDALSNHVVELIQDLNGNHVIQKCINKFSNIDCQFIINSICNNIVKVSTHKHGCCVLQKCLNSSNMNQLHQLGDEIINNSIVLMQDQFGNYVVQYLLSINNYQINEKLIYKIIPSIPILSVQKFSSNVVEKCLKNAAVNTTSKNMMIEEILKPSILTALVKDQFGNYVVQTSLDVANDQYKLRLILAIRPLIPQIKLTPFGRRIQSKISMILNTNSTLNHHVLMASNTSSPHNSTISASVTQPVNRSVPPLQQFYNNGTGSWQQNSAQMNVPPPQQQQQQQQQQFGELSTSSSAASMASFGNDSRFMRNNNYNGGAQAVPEAKSYALLQASQPQLQPEHLVQQFHHHQPYEQANASGPFYL